MTLSPLFVVFKTTSSIKFGDKVGKSFNAFLMLLAVDSKSRTTKI
jgi:hypothetical protein